MPRPPLSLPRIESSESLLAFLRGHLDWPLPTDALADELTFDWSGDELRLPRSASQKLGGGIIRQLRSFVSGQPWGAHSRDVGKFLKS